MNTSPHTDLVIEVVIPYRPDHVSTVRVYDNGGYTNFTSGGNDGIPIDVDSIDRFVDMFDVDGYVAAAVRSKREERRRSIKTRIAALEESVKELDRLRQQLADFTD